jgi:adenine phosphoribosyltransferase
MSQIDLAHMIRNIPDFPQPGIQFKDITTLLRDGPALRQAVDIFVERYRERPLDVIVGVESRGFIFGSALAYALGAGLVLIRKPGKLPAATYEVEYDLEYGTNRLEIHRDAFEPGARALLIDDLLATGGTMRAASSLVEQVGGTVEEIGFLIELTFLDGRKDLSNYSVFSAIQY